MSEQDEIFIKKLKEGLIKHEHCSVKIFHEAKKALESISNKPPERIDILEKVVKDLLVMTVAINDFYRTMFSAINSLFEKHGFALQPIIKIQKQMEDQFLDTLMDSIPKDAKKN